MKRNHRIVLPVLHYLPVIGGFEVFLKNIVERIGRDTELTVITGRVAGVPEVERKGRATILRTASLYPLRDLSYSSYWYVFTMLPFLLWQTLRRVWRKEASLLHANGFFSGVVCLAAHLITGVPYALTIQSADFTIYHKDVRLNLIVWAQAWLERQVYRHAAVCHAVSDDLCAHYRRQGVTECVMIPNGVETELFASATPAERQRTRDAQGIPHGAFVLSNVSRLEPKNGIREFLDAVSLLIPRHPELFVVLVGDGSERPDLERHVDEKNLRGHVKFLGQIRYEDVGPIVAASDAFVRTPRSEGFGIVFLEAMAAGVPVVGTGVGGITDFLHDGITGLSCEAGNSISIAVAIERLVEEPALRARLVQNASAMIREQYDWDKIAERVDQEVYQRVP